MDTPEPNASHCHNHHHSPPHHHHGDQRDPGGFDPRPAEPCRRDKRQQRQLFHTGLIVIFILIDTIIIITITIIF